MKILILQGPVGGYFTHLANHLRRAGFDVRRLVFNGGDIAFSLFSEYTVARLSGVRYTKYFSDYFKEWRPDAVILFGDQRLIHRAASLIARRQGIPVWSFEEGYVRPDHVTFERSGNNALSSVARSFDPTAPVREVAPAPRLKGQTFAMIRAAFVYFITYRVTRSLFPGYRHHRERRLRDEFFFWWRTLGRRGAAVRGDAALVEELIEGKRSPFFLVALQIHDDLQLKRHGRGWRVRPFVDMVLDSFVRAAPKDCRLVIKAHPLDVGYGNNKRNINLQIKERGLGERVDFLQSGPLGPIVQKSLGLITINSTAGFTALRHRQPVITFGDALYQGEGLAIRADEPEQLDRFWTDPTPVDPDRVDRFVSHMIAEALIPGSFYLGSTWDGISREVERKLREAGPAPAAPVRKPVGTQP
jgi:capsular polysaccharide export protein